MKTIYLVPHTHYDVAWAFSREEYFRINVDILNQMLRVMKENPEFKFCLEQTFLLKELEQRKPELWLCLKELIEQERLEIVDGQYLMPDTMLPTGEVLIREILFGKRYCKAKFGIEVPVAWAADSFGMNAQLPQIYRKSGYKWLALRRGARAWITHSEFVWRGLDGTTILTHWMPLGYRAGLYLDRLDESFVDLNKYAATPHILMPCGSGSTPPQPEIPQAVEHWNKTHGEARMKIATPREFFQALEGAEKRFESVEGELYDDELVEVFPQVCTSRLWILQSHRECEGLLMTAEEFATIAWLLGAEYPASELREAWENVLFTAFHDIIAGCGVDEIYKEVKGICRSLKTKLGDILSQSLSYIATKVDTGGEAILVFNPLTWRMQNWAEAHVQIPPEYGGVPGIKERRGVESEVIELKRDEKAGTAEARIGFIADLPPLGYRVYKLTQRGKEPVYRIRVEGETLETPFFRVTSDKETGIVEVLDKEGRLLTKGNEVFIDDEIGDLYHHRARFADLIKSESGKGLEFGAFKPKSFRIENGNLRAKIIFEDDYYCLTWPYRLKEKFPPVLYKHRMLNIRKEVVVFRDLPRIEFITKIKNKHPNIRLNIRFDTGLERKVYYRETQFGVIPEPTEYFSRTRGLRPSEIPNFLSWFCLDDGARGTTFMNKGLPANAIIEDSVYLRLIRSVSGLSADGQAGPLVPTPDALELNRNYTFEYALQHHEGDWRQSEAYKHGQEYHHRPLCTQANASGHLPLEFSFLKISPHNLIISALKKAEDSEDVVLRFFETKGEDTMAEIELFRNIERATVTNLLEQEEYELRPNRNKLKFEVKPFEIVTLKLSL